MSNERGVGLPEMLVVIALVGIAAGVTSLYLAPIETPLDTGSVLLEGMLRQARLKAIASTSAFRVSPGTSQVLVAERARACSDSTWIDDDDLTLELPSGVQLASTSWAVCFSSRGIADTNVVIGLDHPEFGTIQVEVLLGGTTRILP